MKKGLFILILAVVLIITSGCGSAPVQTVKVGEVSPSEAKETSDQEEKAEIKDVYSVGDILMDGDVEIVYCASGEHVENNSFLKPDEGNKYVYMTLAVINHSEKNAFSISSFSFNAYADGYACDSYYGGDDDLSGTLSPGRATYGSVYFEVPKDSKEIEIEYEPNFLSNRKIKFAYEDGKDSGYILQPIFDRTEGAIGEGESVSLDDLNVTYLSSGTFKSDNSFIKPSAGNHFVYLELEFENTGKSDEHISSMIGFYCYADGKKCDQTFVRKDDLSATISAGRKTKGTVGFEVPDDASVIEVEYQDNIWSNNRTVFTIL